MITDVPAELDFRTAGVAYLNLAWDAAIDLALFLDDTDEWRIFNGRRRSPNVSDKYWQAAQRPLSTSIALLQQGTEFLLKSKIAATSPFLLLSSGPRDWPKGCDKRDVAFSEFHTIEAQELVRAHDAVAHPRLPDAFKVLFEGLRKKRNTLMHTVDPTMRISAIYALKAVLEISEILLGPRTWIQTREAYFEASHKMVALGNTVSATSGLLREMLKIRDMFPPDDLARFFGVQPRQKSYNCPSCVFEFSEMNIDPEPTAQLRPNTRTGKNLFCFVCQKQYPVLRSKCSDRACRGTTFEPVDGSCLTCRSSVAIETFAD